MNASSGEVYEASHTLGAGEVVSTIPNSSFYQEKYDHLLSLFEQASLHAPPATSSLNQVTSPLIKVLHMLIYPLQVSKVLFHVL